MNSIPRVPFQKNDACYARGVDGLILRLEIFPQYNLMKIFIFCVLLLVMVHPTWAQTISHEKSVQLYAEVQANPPQITVKWKAQSNTSGFTIYRKTVGSNSWGSAVASLPSSATQYADADVSVGTSYEYQVIRSGSQTGYGYINSGIQVPEVDYLGRVILLVDNSHSSFLASQLTQLEEDFSAEGWSVVRHDVSPNSPVTSVKNLIVSDYNSDPTNTKAVFIVGHVPVPYSGNLAPDGHSSHYGAWSADVYYGDMNGSWTDNSVWNTGSSWTRNHNVPGDGKFDQTTIPSTVELQVGRVDFNDLPAFSQSEAQLLQNYLIKLHKWKVKQITANMQALVDDNFTGYSDGFAANGWRNFGPLVHPDNVYARDYFNSMNSSSYIWSYGCGGGWWDNANGIGYTSDFANNNLKSVFTVLFGSYFGDWDSQNNFMRASLASGTTLTNFWAGYPNWFFHHMGMGSAIGSAVTLTQNNGNGHYQEIGWQSAKVHLSLLGDPTLRMHIVAPPSNLLASDNNGQAQLTWTASSDAVAGYHMYKYNNGTAKYDRITSSIITGTSWSEPITQSSGTIKYMVRAIRLENVVSGSYYNLSLGDQADLVIDMNSVDCAGVAEGGAYFDDCGVCVGGTTGLLPDQDQDCNGVCFGQAAIDNCGICAGGNTGLVPNIDQDCIGVCFGTTQSDCNGECDGTAFMDGCGICAGGNTGIIPNSTADCIGTCGGTATIDDCGVCAGGNSGNIPNGNMDCLGVCFGTAVYDNCGVCDGSNNCSSTTVCLSMPFGTDGDAEEAYSGEVYLDEGPCDLVFDSSPDHWRSYQTTGFRFDGVEVPNGAIVADAYIQFTARTVENVNPCVLNIKAQLDTDAQPISWNNFDLSSRPSTNNSVAWSPPNWNYVDEAGLGQRTPNLKEVVQEIVDQSGWSTNNAVLFLLEGTGGRSAWSYNNDPLKSAQLCVTYTLDTLPVDCLGIPGGTAVIDDCGVCDGDNTSCDRCNQILEVYGSASSIDLFEPIELANDFSLEFWIELDAGIDEKDQPLGDGNSHVLDFQNGHLNLKAPTSLIASSVLIQPFEWTHFAITRQNGNLLLYVNGIEDQNAVSHQFFGDIFISEISTNIGPGWMSGRMDEVRIWSYARSAAQLLAGMNNSVTSTQVGLEAYYRFNENGGPVVDMTGSGHHGVFPSTGLDRVMAPMIINDPCGQSGQDEPEVAFFASQQSICVGESVDFFDASLNAPFGWIWEFEGADSTYSFVQDPSGITWSQPGVYSISLSAMNNFGAAYIEYVSFIEVWPSPIIGGVALNVTCNGEQTGSIQTVVSGGTPSYMYDWDNGQNGQNISNIGVGSYVLTVSDLNGCGNVQTFTIAEPSPIDVANIVSTAETCDFVDGTATINPSGGTVPYTYEWSDPFEQITPTATGLISGSYNVVVTDANNCVANNTVSVNALFGCGGSTALIPNECGQTDVLLDDTLHCIAVANAQSYQFNFNIPGVYNRNIATGSSSTSLPLGWIQSYPLYNGQVYNVRVRAMHNSSWGDWGNVCQISTYTISGSGESRLVSQDCGRIDVLLGDTLQCEPVFGAQDYQFRFENIANSYTRNISIGSSDTKLLLSRIQTNPLQTANTYDVSVRAMLNNSWGAYGPICQISTYTIPGTGETQLISRDCGRIDVLLNDTLHCASVFGAEEYQFRFENVVDNFARNISTGSSDTKLLMSRIQSSPLQNGKTYDVYVRAKLNNSWGTYGSVCQISIFLLSNNTFTTQLNSTWCNATDVELLDIIESDPIPGAQNYQYRFEIPGVYVRNIRSNSSFSLRRLNWYTLPLTLGETYDVSVKVMVSGTWGEYGPVCQLSMISGSMDQGELRSNEITPLSATIFPNPSLNGRVNILLEDIPMEIVEAKVEIFDVNGRVIDAWVVVVPEVSHLLLRNEHELGTGLYLFRVTLGEESQLIRVMVQ